MVLRIDVERRSSVPIVRSPPRSHNSGDAEPLDQPQPPQPPPNPVPSVIGAGAALTKPSQDRPASSTSGFTSLQDETSLGGPAYRNHVDTTIQEAERDVVKRANSSRYFKRGTQRRGVFNSLEEANRLVATALEAIPIWCGKWLRGLYQSAD